MIARANNRGLYVLLAVAFVIAMAYQIGYSISSVQYQSQYDRQIIQPFALKVGSDQFSSVKRALADAGVHPGDRLIEMEGEPYQGSAQIARILAGKRPGDTIAVKVQAGGQAETRMLPVALQPLEHVEMTLTGWLVFGVLTIFTPMFCLALGFFVALLRPRDPLAWLVLALMLGFAQMSTTGVGGTSRLLEWPAGLRQAAVFYCELLGNTWQIWILLFGIYFPDRLSLDRRWPWLKWILIVPIAAQALGEALIASGEVENFRTLAWLFPFTQSLQWVLYLGMLAVSFFFTAIWMKIGQASSADSRRRLVLLVTGTSLALTPIFGLVLYGLAGHKLESVRPAVWVPCILMLGLFPITLAYVIVVQRALDVRVVIRQGLRYALAKRAMLALQVIAMILVLFGGLFLATDPTRNRPRKITAIGSGIAAAVWIRRAGASLLAWVDRRFFREAYDAEQILSDLGDQVRTMVETGPLLETVAKQISASMHVSHVAMLVRNHTRYQTAYALGFAAPPGVEFDDTAGTVAQLKQTREPLRIYFDDGNSWIYHQASVTASERARLLALDAQLLLPLAFKEKLIGFMSLSGKRSEEPYSKSDVKLLESLATQTGLALENSQLSEAFANEVAQRERLNRELEIAREVQERLFPQTCPAIAGLDYGGTCRPALGVGGDYYDFIELPEGSLGIAIGDVSGKGIPAALLMASLQASLRGQTIAGSADLAKLMSNINQLIFAATPSNRYATFFYGQYEPRTRQFVFVNGGHNPPIILRGSEVLRLEDGGPVVGLFKPAKYSQASVELKPGDVMVLFTDGISEAMNAEDEEWGEDRLIECTRLCGDQPAREMMEILMKDADAFVAGAPQHDDMTILVVKIS